MARSTQHVLPPAELRRTAGRNAVINVVLFGVVIYIFASQFDGLTASLETLRQAEPIKVILAIFAVILSFPIAALAYHALVDGRVRYAPTLAVQVASGFINRLLPAGLGSMGLYAAYLKRQGMTLPEASAAVATNNLLGVVGNLLLVAAVLTAQPIYLNKIDVPQNAWAIAAGLLAAGAVIAIVVAKRHRLHVTTGTLTGFFRNTLESLGARLRPSVPTALALAYNMMLTCLNAAALSLATLALGGVIGWGEALLILSFGTMLGAAIPTPGGIGAVEAGLLAGMLGFGIDPAAGLAAVLLYRGLTYWLPIIPGVLMFRIVEKRILT